MNPRVDKKLAVVICTHTNRQIEERTNGQIDR